MAEVWGMAAVAGATIYSANRASAASRAGQRGAEAATAETARQYDQTRADLAPWRTTGGGALNRLADLFGLPSTTPEQFTAAQDQLVGDTMLPSGATFNDKGKGWYDVLYGGSRVGYLRPGGANGRFVNDTGADINALRRQSQQGASTPGGAPNRNAFFESPGYQFRRDEGMRGIERTAAARGGAFSGNALRALTDFNSNLASNEFGNYVNQLAGIAGVGQSATNQTAAYGADAANSASRNALFAGQSRASGIENQANIIGDGVNSLAGLWGYYSQNKKPRAYGGTGYGGSPWMTPGYGDGVRYG